MATITVRMPDDKSDRLKDLARSRNISVNKLFDEWATMAIAAFDTKAGFLARQSRGSRERGLAALRELNRRDEGADEMPLLPEGSSYASSFALHEPQHDFDDKGSKK